MRLCEHFARARRGDGRRQMRPHRNRFRRRGAWKACERCLKVFAEGKDETALAYVKLAVAEHLLHFAETDKPTSSGAATAPPVSPLPYFREMRVVARRGRDAAHAPHHARRRGPRPLCGRRSACAPADPDDRTARPVWPMTGEDGRPSWPDGDDGPTSASIRSAASTWPRRSRHRLRPARGDRMPGARFAAGAKPGDIGRHDRAGRRRCRRRRLVSACRRRDGAPGHRAHPGASARGRTAPWCASRSPTPAKNSRSVPSRLDVRWLHRNGPEPAAPTCLPKPCGGRLAA